MPELKFDESRLQDLILDNLDEEEHELFVRVHRLNCGCAIMGHLDEHPNEMLTVDDLAFLLQEPRRMLEPAIRELGALGLIRRMSASGLTFYGLAEGTETRRQVHELFNWQRAWHTRLARIENLVNGHSSK